jgi:hypothetical protein
MIVVIPINRNAADDINHPYGRQLSWQAYARFYNYASRNKPIEEYGELFKKNNRQGIL